MKKLMILLMVFALCGCNSVNTVSRIEAQRDKKLKVYTSFYGIYDFVNKIGGDKIELHNIVPTGTEPHDWEPSTKNMLNLEKADILFYNGLGMETWVEKVQASIDNNNLQYINLSQNINTLEENTDDKTSDPHVWLDPKNVKIEMESIKNALSNTDPYNKDYYAQNYLQYYEMLDKLDNDYKEEISKFKSKDIVVAHEAYEYLCKAYGLSQIAIEGISANSEPSPMKMAEITKFIKENNIKYIFFEEFVNPKVAKTIADEAEAQLLILNPFEGLTDEQIEEKQDYFSVMYENLENLKKALGE